MQMDVLLNKQFAYGVRKIVESMFRMYCLTSPGTLDIESALYIYMLQITKFWSKKIILSSGGILVKLYLEPIQEFP